MNVMKLLSLDGKVAIVTGGRGLYGSAISEGMCEAGATVVIASRNGAKCDEYAKTLRDQGYKCYGMSLDLGSDESIVAFVNGVQEKFGKIDILVNNAVDRSNMVGFPNATREKLQASVSTNLNGQIILSQKVIEVMLEKETKGSVVNITSMRGIDCPHFPFYPPEFGEQAINYTTEKWAMVGMTKFMAGRYGKNGIRVNCIAPGGYNGNNPGEKVNDESTFAKNYRANCPLGDWAQYDDIKGPVVFLSSDAAAYVTGATLVMDGGWTIW